MTEAIRLEAFKQYNLVNAFRSAERVKRKAKPEKYTGKDLLRFTQRVCVCTAITTPLCTKRRAEMRREMENRNSENIKHGKDENTIDKNAIDEQDIENILKILEDFSASETSRMKIQTTEEQAQGQVERKYHHGRCDVGSPWAKGESFDVLE